MSVVVYPGWWDAAQAECFDGHPESCTYGGLSPSGGYWLEVEGCGRSHGERCAACGGDAETGFAGWGPGGTVWRVPVCEGHAGEIVALDPGTWKRR